VEDLHGRRIVEVEHQRRAELGETPDQHDRPAREQARSHERERDATEDRPPRRPEIRRRLLHRWVEVGQGGRDVEEKDGVQRQRLDEYDAHQSSRADPIHRRARLHETDGVRDAREYAEPAEDLPHPDRADEWRQDQRDEQQPVGDRLAPEVEPHAHQRQRHGDQRANARHADRDDRAVEQTLAQRMILEDGGDVAEREPAAGAGLIGNAEERDLQYLPDGPKQKDREDREDDGEDDRMAQTSHLPVARVFNPCSSVECTG
jgi:hypothetical protein